MEQLHSSSSSSRAEPEGMPDGSVRSDSGMPENEHSQTQHNIPTAAAGVGMPTSAVLQNPQSAAADSGMPESAVLQPPTQPMEGVTDQSVPPEMYKNSGGARSLQH